MLFYSNHALCLVEEPNDNDSDSLDSEVDLPLNEGHSLDIDAANIATLHLMRISTMLTTIDEDLRYWVKLRSTTWFTRFLLHKYDDHYWVQMFRMSKRSVISLL